jgi:phosphatidylglycerophosphatase C
VITTLKDDVPPLAAEQACARVVLFDFDGVLIHGDAFYLFMRERYARSLWRKSLALLSVPLLLPTWPFSRRWVMRWLVRIALLGLRPEGYALAANAFAATLVRRPRLFCRAGLSALRRHQAQGDRVIVVTGCEQTLVDGIVRQLGLGGLEIMASQLRPGWFGMGIGRHNIGPRKVETLASHGVGAWQLAYGDSLHDAAMLKAAGEAVLVNGTPKLCRKMEKLLGRPPTRVDWW